MRPSNELVQSGFSFYVACGIVCAFLFGLFIWQTKTSEWIGEAVKAESLKTSAEPEFTGTTAVPMRKSIGPTAWTEVASPSK